MKKRICFAAVSLCALMLAGCGGGFYREMGRVARDPVIEAPLVESYVEEGAILASWNPDVAADEYILERAVDVSTALSYVAVYRGSGLSFTDPDCADGTRYLYRLRKARGDRIFDASSPVLGVGSVTSGDSHEPNDTDETATPLTSLWTANLFYYRSFPPLGAEVKDEDWYSVVIPAGYQAHIIVTQITPALTGGSTDTWLYFCEKGGPAIQVTNNLDAYLIKNTYPEQRTFYFKLMPVPDLFATGPFLTGGNMVLYSVGLNSIDKP